MKQHKLWSALLASCGFLILIFDSKTALNGALSGMDICMKTVIPSLFPFFVMSISLTNVLSGMHLRVLQPIGKLFYIPKGAEGILISAFLGGYPAGAQSIAFAYKNNTLSLSDARRMLTYCNNAGPAFLFGMVSPFLSGQNQIWLLWGIHIASAFILAQLAGSTEKQTSFTTGQVHKTSDIMLASIKAMSTVCGWVLIFRVILAFLFRWFLWILPKELQVLIAGILELSNGCLLLSEIKDNSLRFIMASGLLSFGGLCVTMQTRSVTEDLFCKEYIMAKFLQATLSILFAISAVYIKWTLPFLIAGICLFLHYMRRKNSSISEPSVV